MADQPINSTPAPLPQEVDLIHPSGEMYTVPASSVKQAIQAGYKFPDQAQVTENYNEATYGERPFSAAALGATSTIPFGLHIATKTGITTPEHAKQIMERNPKSTMAGEVAGIAGQLLLAPELSAAGKIAKAGQGVEAVAGKVLGQGLAKVAGSATEGALYGLNNVINEQALGDPNLTGEAALAQIGASAFWGGAAGGLLHGATTTIPPVINAAREAIDGSLSTLGLGSAVNAIKNVAKDKYASLSSVVSGVAKEDILAAIENRGTSAIPLKADEVSRGLESQYRAINKAKQVAIDEIRPIESERLVQTHNPDVAKLEHGKIFNRLDETINEIRSNPDVYPQRYASKLEQMKDALQAVDPEARPHQFFSALDELKGKIDKQIKYGKFPTPGDEDAQALIKGFRKELKESLENPDTFGNAGTRQAAFNEAVSEHLGVEKEFQKAFMRKSITRGGNAEYVMDPVKVENFLKYSQTPKGEMRADILSRYSNSSKQLLEQIGDTYKALPDRDFNGEAVRGLIERNNGVLEQQRQQGVMNSLARGAKEQGEGGLLEGAAGAAAAHAAGIPHPVIASGVAIYQGLRYPGQTIQRLSRLEESLSKTAKTVMKGAKALVGPAEKTAKYLRGYAGAKAAILPTQQFQKIADGIRDMIANPETLVDKFAKNTEGLNDHAPMTSNALQQAGSRSIAFLAQKLPPQPQGGPLVPKLPPSNAEIATFTRYYNAVEEPLSILQDAARGTLTREGVEAVGTVYPALMQKMQGEIMAQLTEVKEPIPYSRRMMLTLLLGGDVDGSMNPQLIQSNQALLSVSAAQAQQHENALINGGTKPRAAGLDNLSQSEQNLTPMQLSNQRNRN